MLQVKFGREQFDKFMEDREGIRERTKSNVSTPGGAAVLKELKELCVDVVPHAKVWKNLDDYDKMATMNKIATHLLACVRSGTASADLRGAMKDVYEAADAADKGQVFQRLAMSWCIMLFVSIDLF